MVDPIADILIRIKNGYMARKNKVSAPYSKITFQIVSILKKEGFIKDVQVLENSKETLKHKTIEIVLRYPHGKPALEAVKRISKPGRRIYADYAHLPNVLSGYGIAILSTSKGLMTNKQAKKEHIGGEVLCYVW